MRFTEDYRDWALDQFYCKYLETEDVRFAALAVGTGCSNPPDWALRVLEQAADEHLIGTSNFEDKSGGGRRHEDPLGDGLLLLAVAAWYLLGSTANAAIRAVTKQTSGETDFRRLHELWKKNSHPVAWQIDGKVVDVENKWTIRARKNGYVKEADVIPYHFRQVVDEAPYFPTLPLRSDAADEKKTDWEMEKARRIERTKDRRRPCDWKLCVPPALGSEGEG